MKFRQLADVLVYIVLRILLCAVQAMRIETCQIYCRGLAYLAADVFKLRHKIIDENLRHAFPAASGADRQKLAREMWESLTLMVCEIAHLPRKLHDTNWRNHVRLQNIAPQVAALLSPRPAVMLTFHYGNFDAAGYLAGLFGFTTYTIGRPLDNPFLDRWLTEFRQSKGQRMLPKQGVAQHVALLLEQGKNLVLLGDQYGGQSGCWIDFFGRPASYHKAIALFPITSNAPLVVGYCKRIGGPLQFELGVSGSYDPAVPETQLGGVREVTRWYNNLMQEEIRTSPAQYWWLHRRWKDTRTPQRRRRDERRRQREQQRAA